MPNFIDTSLGGGSYGVTPSQLAGASWAGNWLDFYLDGGYLRTHKSDNSYLQCTGLAFAVLDAPYTATVYQIGVNTPVVLAYPAGSVVVALREDDGQGVITYTPWLFYDSSRAVAASVANGFNSRIVLSGVNFPDGDFVKNAVPLLEASTAYNNLIWRCANASDDSSYNNELNMFFRLNAYDSYFYEWFEDANYTAGNYANESHGGILGNPIGLLAIVAFVCCLLFALIALARRFLPLGKGA